MTRPAQVLHMLWPLMVAGVLVLPWGGFANTGAAQVAAGGLVLRREPRVAMRAERLHIAPSVVKVAYQFVNESSSEVVTDILFPMPDYCWDEALGVVDIADVKLFVSGRRIPIARSSRAILRPGPGERDVTDLVASMGLSVDRFGGLEDTVRVDSRGVFGAVRERSPIASLPEKKKGELRSSGLMSDGPPLEVNWCVRSSYSWIQEFPPAQPVDVRLEYSPAYGYESYAGQRELVNACAPEALRKAVAEGKYSALWVTYVLTTASTWKTPIGAFELRVDRVDKGFVSFCWDGKVEQTPAGLRASATGFVPSKEVTVYFFEPREFRPPTRW